MRYGDLSKLKFGEEARPTAFERWFRECFSDNVIGGAQYLFMCIRDGGTDSVAWQWLDKTGDNEYSEETFIKAAKLILEAK